MTDRTGAERFEALRERNAIADARPRPHLSPDARNTILVNLREALNVCAEQNDYDAVLFIVVLMRKTHDEP